MIPKPRKLILQIIIWILVIYFILLAYLFIFQRNLMYHPQQNNYPGDKIEVEIEKVQIQTTDNISLLGWFHKKDLKKFRKILARGPPGPPGPPRGAGHKKKLNKRIKVSRALDTRGA